MSLSTQQYTASWLLFGALVAFYIIHLYRKYARLSAFPGPPTTGWSHVWAIRHMLGSKRQFAWKALNDTYGPIARIGPNDLMTSSPELVTRINAVRSSYTRTRWFYGGTRVEPGKDHVLSEIDEDKHNKRRAQMAAGYSGKDNVGLEPDIDNCVQDFIELLKSKYLSTKSKAIPVDFSRKVQYLTVDVITKIGFGKAFGDLKNDADMGGYLEHSEQGFAIICGIVALGLAPILQWPPLARLIGPSEKDASGLGKVMGIVRSRINERLENPTEGRSDMLASFTNHGLTRDDLFVEAFLQMVAGSDTSATAIRSTMLYVLSNPRVYRKLQIEVDAAAPGIKGNIAPDSLLRTLPYLQAVVREGLRIHPPAALEAPKVVPRGGDTVTIEDKEYYLPGGTNIWNNSWGVHRKVAIFGADAEEFRPERWLPSPDAPPADEEARLANMRRVNDLNFGHGKYQCLGKTIAWMEITKALFECIRRFDWAIGRPEKPWMSYNYNGVFRQDNLMVVVSEREGVVA